MMGGGMGGGSDEGGMGGVASGAMQGAQIGGPWGAVAGAGLGLLQGQENARKKANKNYMNAQMVALSPWLKTGGDGIEAFTRDTSLNKEGKLNQGQHSGADLGMAGFTSGSAQDQNNAIASQSRKQALMQAGALAPQPAVAPPAVAPPAGPSPQEAQAQDALGAMNQMKASKSTQQAAGGMRSPYGFMIG